MLDDTIREFADIHEVGELSDDQVNEVRSTLSNAYIDDVLDGTSSLSSVEGDES